LLLIEFFSKKTYNPSKFQISSYHHHHHHRRRRRRHYKCKKRHIYCIASVWQEVFNRLLNAREMKQKEDAIGYNCYLIF
jgi:hypothetical protein